MSGQQQPNSPTQQQQQQGYRGIRSSKFKHVYGCPFKKEKCYDNVLITKNAHDSQFCAINPKFLAVVTESSGGGCFIVIPLESSGRIGYDCGKVTGHSGPVLEIKWNPFNDNIIASASDDCTIKLWQIPDGGPPRRGISDPLVTLAEHKRRVSMIEFHPSAENILVSASYDLSIIVWHTSRAQVLRVINVHPDTIQSISLNRDGSYVATTCKDKVLRIIDLRRGEVLNSGVCHEGSKSSKVVYLGDSGRLFTTGFSRFSDRQWAVWSQLDLRRPLRLENIDSSSGVLFPFYDHDTQMVYVAGKGDGSIRYYELVDTTPYCYYLNQFLTGFPQRGLGIMPKRGLNPNICEVFRFYKLHATRPVVEPISMIVPRKSQLFQSDLYPDTAAPNSSMTAEEWLAGKNRLPALMSMKSAAIAGKTNKQVVVHKNNHSTNGVDKHHPQQQIGQYVNRDEEEGDDGREIFSTLSSSVNNDRKFLFLSEVTPVDYRPKPLPRSDSQEIFRNVTSTAVNNNSQNHPYPLTSTISASHVPLSATFSTISRDSRRRHYPHHHHYRDHHGGRFSGWPMSGDDAANQYQRAMGGKVQKCYSAINLMGGSSLSDLTSDADDERDPPPPPRQDLDYNRIRRRRQSIESPPDSPPRDPSSPMSPPTPARRDSFSSGGGVHLTPGDEMRGRNGGHKVRDSSKSRDRLQDPSMSRSGSASSLNRANKEVMNSAFISTSPQLLQEAYREIQRLREVIRVKDDRIRELESIIQGVNISSTPPSTGGVD